MTNIILTFKDRYLLSKQTLDSLYTNTPRESFNLTIVDDGSEDFRVRNLLSQFGAQANATLVRLENSGRVLASVKRAGIKVSSSLFGYRGSVYLGDGDSYFLPNWLEVMELALVEGLISSHRVIAGQIHPYLAVSDNYFDVDESHTCRTCEVVDGPSLLAASTTFAAYYKSNPGGQPGPCQSEDVAFCERVRKSGRKIGVIQPFVVLHTGLTNSNGDKAPGYEERKAQRVPGVLYE